MQKCKPVYANKQEGDSLYFQAILRSPCNAERDANRLNFVTDLLTESPGGPQGDSKTGSRCTASVRGRCPLPVRREDVRGSQLQITAYEDLKERKPQVRSSGTVDGIWISSDRLIIQTKVCLEISFTILHKYVENDFPKE